MKSRHFKNNPMIFIDSHTPYVELETGENADLYHYPIGEIASDENRYIKPNHAAFGAEIARRWNAFESDNWPRLSTVVGHYLNGTIIGFVLSIVIVELLK